MRRSSIELARDNGQRDRTPLIIAALIALVVTIIFLAAAFGILRERRLIIGETQRSTANLARTLEEHSRLTFEGVIHSLNSAAQYINVTPGSLRPGDPATRETLRHIVRAVPYLSNLTITDSTGRLVADVLDNDSALGANLSSSPTFKLLRDNSNPPFVVSEAEKSAKHGGWVIFIAIRLSSPTGEFRGTAIGALNVNHFSRFYEAINVGKFGAIKLVRRDGVILTRRPEAFIGKSVAKGPLFTVHLAESAMGTVDIVTATDGLRRILSYRALSHFPIVVVVSASRNEVLAPWFERTRMTAFFAAALMVPIFGLLFLFLRAHRRQVVENAERRRVESQFFNAIEHVKEGVALYDADDRMVVCNSTYRDQWNKVARIVAQGQSFETIIRKAIDTGTIDVIEEERESRIGEIMSFHRQPGPTTELLCGGRWLLLHENKLPDGGVIQITPDVTELKQREQECRMAMEAAEQANAAKSRFLEAANHDLRQPLQALNLMSYALLKRPDDARKVTIVDNMRHAIDAMEAVLNGLLDIGKFESGRIELRESVFRLSDLFRRIEAEFGLQAQSFGIEMTTVESSLVVRSDFDLLSRIIENFLSNAVRYTESGRILLGVRRRGDHVRIEVWDTGVGIPEDQLENIFEEFYQLHNPARNRSKGFGLGLSIVDRIAKLIDAPIDVRSVPGRGSMFAVTVPLSLDAQITRQAERPRSEIEREFSSSILVIEDDEAVLEATRMMLEDWGAHVDCALTAREAFALVNGEGCRPDLIVSDHRLPEGETGVELLRQLTDVIGSPVPGLIITGDTSEAHVREARLAGYPVLRKPVDPEKLREFIGLALAS